MMYTKKMVTEKLRQLMREVPALPYEVDAENVADVALLYYWYGYHDALCNTAGALRMDAAKVFPEGRA